MTKHTPGPWHRNIAPASKYTVVFAGRNTHVARVTPEGHSEETCEANINLIAAAPELLDSIKDLLGYAAWEAIHGKTVIVRAEAELRHAKAVAAIAKAEGR